MEDQSELEKTINQFETPKTEEKSQIDLLQYRIPRSMFYGGISVVTTISINSVRIKSEYSPFLIAVAFFSGTVAAYGISLAMDGIKKLKNKDHHPSSWFL